MYVKIGFKTLPLQTIVLALVIACYVCMYICTATLYNIIILSVMLHNCTYVHHVGTVTPSMTPPVMPPGKICIYEYAPCVFYNVHTHL